VTNLFIYFRTLISKNLVVLHVGNVHYLSQHNWRRPRDRHFPFPLHDRRLYEGW